MLILTGCGGKSGDGGLFEMIEDPKTWSRTYEQYQNDSKYALKEESDTTIKLTTKRPMNVYGVDVSPEFWFQKADKGGPPSVIYVIVGNKDEDGLKYTQDLTDFYESMVVEVINKYTVTDRRYVLAPDGSKPDSSTPCLSATDILSIPRPEINALNFFNCCSVRFESEIHKMEIFFSMYNQGDSFSLRIAPKEKY